MKPPKPPRENAAVTMTREASSILPRLVRMTLTNIRQRKSAMASGWARIGMDQFIPAMTIPARCGARRLPREERFVRASIFRRWVVDHHSLRRGFALRLRCGVLRAIPERRVCRDE